MIDSRPQVYATDSELLMRFSVHNDADAFEDLLLRHSPTVYQVCRRILRNEEDVEDAYQTTFLILTRKAKIIHCTCLAGWLYRVAYNASLEIYNKRSRDQTESFSDEVNKSLDDVLSNIHDQEIAMVLDLELSKLPESLRTPLVLHYLEGNSIQEVSQKLDCTINAVNLRLMRGKKKLRARMIRQGISLSLAMTLVSGGITQAKAMSLSPLVQVTVSQCVASLSAGNTYFSSILLYLTLTKERISSMLIYKWAKPLIITTAIFFLSMTAVMVTNSNGQGQNKKADSSEINSPLEQQDSSNENGAALDTATFVSKKDKDDTKSKENSAGAKTSGNQKNASQAQLKKWIKDLDSRTFKTRELARYNLANTGKASIPHLLKAAFSKDSSAEVVASAEKIIINFCLSKNKELSENANIELTKMTKSKDSVISKKANILLHMIGGRKKVLQEKKKIVTPPDTDDPFGGG